MPIKIDLIKMKNAINKWVIIAISATLTVPSVFSYLDPGTGGAILGSLWPLLVAIFTAIGAFLTKFFWKPIKGIFSKILKRNG